MQLFLKYIYIYIIYIWNNMILYLRRTFRFYNNEIESIAQGLKGVIIYFRIDFYFIVSLYQFLNTLLKNNKNISTDDCICFLLIY